MEEKRSFRRGPREREDAADQIEGRNAVSEALKSGRTLDKVFVASGDTDRALARLAALAREAGAAVVQVDRRRLDQMSATGAHQGIIALAAAHGYATVEEILQRAADRGEAPLLDRKSTRLNSSHVSISYAVFCLKKKKKYYFYNLPVSKVVIKDIKVL